MVFLLPASSLEAFGDPAQPRAICGKRPIKQKLKTSQDFCSNSCIRDIVLLSSWSRPWMISEDFRLMPEIHSRQRLHSASSTDAVVPVTCRSSLGDHAFPVAGARAWNVLPPRVTSVPSLSLFIPATSENFSVPTTTASITLITVSWFWSACTQHHVIPGRLNWTDVPLR